jgi:hypothetical protein
MNASAARNWAAVVFPKKRARSTRMGGIGNPDIIQLGMLGDFEDSTSDSNSTASSGDDKRQTITVSFVAGLAVGLFSGFLLTRVMSR